MSWEPEAAGHRPQATGEPLELRVTSHESLIPSREKSRTTPVDVERTDPMRTDHGIDISVLVPAKDEAENLPRFMELAAKALGSGSLRYEVVVIDDGSVDDSWNVLEKLRQSYPFLRAVRHRLPSFSRRGPRLLSRRLAIPARRYSATRGADHGR
jgi:cellulose synthase/poly-beta-1,6-N-acetylglucosamine synthase-like glycosyltransferase